jgi:hypothetical protein
MNDIRALALVYYQSQSILYHQTPSEPAVSEHHFNHDSSSVRPAIRLLFYGSTACHLYDTSRATNALRSRRQHAFHAAGHCWPDACQHRITNTAPYQI